MDRRALTGDGKNNLIALEGNYSGKPECRGNYAAVWQWNGWWFANEWRSDSGNFSGLDIEKIGGISYIIVDSF